MAKPIARVLALLEILQRHGGLRTVADLADRLGVDERTVRRYVQHLVDLDIPIEAVRGRHGGYRLAPGYRMPPLMLGDEEALAVLLGLTVARRAGLVVGSAVAAETAAAKVRRVLPAALGRRLDAVIATVDLAGPADRPGAPETRVLLTVARAALHRRPLSMTYTSREGRRSERTVHPYGIVAHAGHWYLSGADSDSGDVRTFRLDRVDGATELPGSFEAPADVDPATHVLAGLAGTPYAHEVSVLVQASAQQVRARLPGSLATVQELPAGAGPDDGADWVRLRLGVARLGWVPALLASLDRPFVVEHPAALRDEVRALADRLVRSADAPERRGRRSGR